MEKTETIEVSLGLIIILQFTAFDIAAHSTCDFGHLTITDGDGTILMEKSCGSSLPAPITSRSNKINLIFITGSLNSRFGWSASWSVVTLGKCTIFICAVRSVDFYWIYLDGITIAFL